MGMSENNLVLLGVNVSLQIQNWSALVIKWLANLIRPKDSSSIPQGVGATIIFLPIACFRQLSSFVGLY